MHEVHLKGASPVPLASYLKGLGVFRLLAEQADHEIRAYWVDECMVLLTVLDAAAVMQFFLEQYRPTPLLAPWNGGSGFYRPGNETAWKTLELVRHSGGTRFAPLTQAIQQMTEVVAELGLEAKPEGEVKRELLLRLRAVLDDQALTWFDAAVLLTQESPRYPPLLGTGGNDGRLDFTSNFLQRLGQLFDLETGAPSSDAVFQLDSALFDHPAPGLVGGAVGQFAPGTAGGPNSSTTGFGSKSKVNPWDYVLMLEGALLFATSASRRLQSVRSGMSFPFTTRSTGTGAGSSALSDEEAARAEMWMPLWSSPASLAELQVVLREGRVSLQRSTASDGLDFARAVAKLGVDRGITAFQRYAFLNRSGKAYLATPLNRFPVRRNPNADLIDQLDRHGWLARLRQMGRSKNAPVRFQMLLRRLEDDLFQLAQGRGRYTAQAVLVSLGAIQAYMASSPAIREAVTPPPRLEADWALTADDGSHEFRIAAGLAGIDGGLPMRLHFAPLDPTKFSAWKADSRLHVWRHGSLEDNLYRIVLTRLLHFEREGRRDGELFAARCPADGAAVAAFIEYRTDDRRIADLLAGLTLVNLPDTMLCRPDADNDVLPAAYALLKPFFAPDRVLQSMKVLAEDKRLPLPASIPRLLRAQRTAEALEVARRRRRAASIPTADLHLDSGRQPGLRLLAALAIPIDLKLLRAVQAQVGQGELPAATMD